MLQPPVSAPFLFIGKTAEFNPQQFHYKYGQEADPKRGEEDMECPRCSRKKKLDPNKLAQIREVSFQLYPCEYGENSDACWRNCCKAIDELCRWLAGERCTWLLHYTDEC